MLTRSGNRVIKLILHVLQAEQWRRFLERLTAPDKYWRFLAAGFHERQYWDAYGEACEDMLSATSSPHAPWYVILADHKLCMRAAVADIIAARINALDLRIPEVSKEKLRELTVLRDALESEAKQ